MKRITCILVSIVFLSLLTVGVASSRGKDAKGCQDHPLAQEVTADAMYSALNKDGFMSLYFNFDTGKSDIKPESMAIIGQIAALLQARPELKVSIEGHTDNAGILQSNKVLSTQRAKSVLNAVAQKGIAVARLTALGWGQEKPIADNRSEEGKAKNRRVEIVKK